MVGCGPEKQGLFDAKNSFYFGPLNQPLFGTFHSPRGDFRNVGVLLCNPLGDELARAHRTFRHLAERLAHSGFGVLRFDYRGTGDSFGDEKDVPGAETWIEDIGHAATELKKRSGAEKICAVGLKLGATLAACLNFDSLIFWEGFSTGNDFVQEILRLHTLQTRLDPDGFKAARKPENGDEAFGFLLTSNLGESLKKIDLSLRNHSPARTILNIQSSKKAKWTLSSHWRDLGTQVLDEIQPTPHFLSMTPHLARLPEETLNLIQDRLNQLYPERRSVSAPTPPEKIYPYNEKPICWGNDGLFGILHIPSNPSDSAIVLLNAGTVHRIGPHRLYVKMARKWAEMGYWVLRMDLTGTGDTPVEPGTQENVTYPGRAKKDIQSALEMLSREYSLKRFILAGLCSGGDNAFQSGLTSSGVEKVIILNPRTFLLLPLDDVESVGESRYYKSSLKQKEKWKKLFRGEIRLSRSAKRYLRKLPELLLERKNPKADQVPDRLRDLAERGVHTLLLHSKGDPGVSYVQSFQGKALKKLDALRRFKRIELEGMNHTFTSLSAQEIVIKAVTEFIEQTS